MDYWVCKLKVKNNIQIKVTLAVKYSRYFWKFDSFKEDSDNW